MARREKVENDFVDAVKGFTVSFGIFAIIAIVMGILAQ